MMGSGRSVDLVRFHELGALAWKAASSNSQRERRCDADRIQVAEILPPTPTLG